MSVQTNIYRKAKHLETAIADAEAVGHAGGRTSMPMNRWREIRDAAIELGIAMRDAYADQEIDKEDSLLTEEHDRGEHGDTRRGDCPTCKDAFDDGD